MLAGREALDRGARRASLVLGAEGHAAYAAAIPRPPRTLTEFEQGRLLKVTGERRHGFRDAFIDEHRKMFGVEPICAVLPIGFNLQALYNLLVGLPESWREEFRDAWGELEQVHSVAIVRDEPLASTENRMLMSEAMERMRRLLLLAQSGPPWN